MKLTIPRKTLHEALGRVGRAVASQSCLPSLKGILLQVEDGKPGLYLAATDLELAIATTVDAGDTQPGALCVPAGTLREIIGALPEADVTLTAKRDHLKVQCRRSDYRVGALSAEEFPALPEVQGVSFAVPSAELRRLIRETQFAASDDDTRPILTGILFLVGGGKLRLVSTNTHQLQLAETSIEGDAEQVCIVPSQALRELLRFLPEDENAVVTMDDNQAMFETGDTRLTTRLIAGVFPNYERVIPQRPARTAVLCAADLASIARRCKIIATDAAAKDRIVMTFDGGTLRVTAQGETGEAIEQMELSGEWQGEEFSLALNSQYLLETLGVAGDPFRLGMDDPLAPVLMTWGESASKAVLMPMQVQ